MDNRRTANDPLGRRAAPAHPYPSTDIEPDKDRWTTRIPDQTIGHRGVAVDFGARWRLEVSSVSRDPFYLLVLHAGRV